MKTKKIRKQILLDGEGRNRHVLEADATVSMEDDGYNRICVHEDGLLQHETPEGLQAEHNTLKVEKGNWVLGRQMEYDPFMMIITNVWD
jgi:hypothetical protein